MGNGRKGCPGCDNDLGGEWERVYPGEGRVGGGGVVWGLGVSLVGGESVACIS